MSGAIEIIAASSMRTKSFMMPRVVSSNACFSAGQS
jgi:hypothetical protein